VPKGGALTTWERGVWFDANRFEDFDYTVHGSFDDFNDANESAPWLAGACAARREAR
jgi:hypothetical protein